MWATGYSEPVNIHTLYISSSLLWLLFLLLSKKNVSSFQASKYYWCIFSEWYQVLLINYYFPRELKGKHLNNVVYEALSFQWYKCLVTLWFLLVQNTLIFKDMGIISLRTEVTDFQWKSHLSHLENSKYVHWALRMTTATLTKCLQRNVIASEIWNTIRENFIFPFWPFHWTTDSEGTSLGT